MTNASSASAGLTKSADNILLSSDRQAKSAAAAPPSREQSTAANGAAGRMLKAIHNICAAIRSDQPKDQSAEKKSHAYKPKSYTKA